MTYDPETYERALLAAGQGLARANIFDDRMTADEARIAAWADALAPHSLEAPDVLAAVTAYYSTPGVQAIKVGDVIAEARKIRRERAERDKGQQIANAPAIAAPDGQFGGLPIGGVDGDPVWTAYEQHNAIEQHCETCDAEPDQACVNLATGTTRKIPCLSRIQAGVKAVNGGAA